MEHLLICTKCGTKTDDYSLFRCRRCNSILEVQYDYSKMSLPKNFKKQKINHKKYLPLLPVSSFGVKLTEGGTPLIKKNIKGIDVNIFFKIETKNPTHSFKDRGSAVEISRALELGFGHVTCGSTGNMGISIAKYAKTAGIKSTIFISKDANPRKLAMIKQNRGELVKIRGDFNKAVRSAEIFAKNNDAFVCGDYHYRKEGQKTMIFEILDQFSYNPPDFIFIPIGNATLLAGMYKGLEEYKRFSLIKKFPRLIAIQSDMCNPLVRAYNSKKHIEYMVPRTIADAIAVGYPTFGFEGMRALSRTNGLAVDVSEEQIEDAVSQLKRIGIKSEAGGATGYAGFLKLNDINRRLFTKKRVVVLITGNNETM